MPERESSIGGKGDVTRYYLDSQDDEFVEFINKHTLGERKLIIRIDIKDFDFSAIERFLHDVPVGQEREVFVRATEEEYHDLIDRAEQHGIAEVKNIVLDPVIKEPPE